MEEAGEGRKFLPVGVSNLDGLPQEESRQGQKKDKSLLLTLSRELPRAMEMKQRTVQTCFTSMQIV